MDLFNQIIELTENKDMQLCEALDKTLGTEFVMGMSDHVIYEGSLGAGHEHLTMSQKFKQATKECFVMVSNIKLQRAMAKKHHADLLDAKGDC